jgi:hypothetical protein
MPGGLACPGQRNERMKSHRSLAHRNEDAQSFQDRDEINRILQDFLSRQGLGRRTTEPSRADALIAFAMRRPRLGLDARSERL